MSNWIVDIETADGIATDSGDLARFSCALDDLETVPGTAASLNSKTGAVSATFTVGGADPVGAAEVCVAAFCEALSASGLTSDPVRVVVERVPSGDATAV